jgi:hypothetical protein
MVDDRATKATHRPQTGPHTEIKASIQDVSLGRGRRSRVQSFRVNLVNNLEQTIARLAGRSEPCGSDSKRRFKFQFSVGTNNG